MPDLPYEIGYGKPPRSAQFTKGNSGNPKGRPKGSKNLASIILAESRRPVRINGQGGTRTVRKIEATVMQMANKSAQGDLRAARDFIPLVRHAEESVAAGSGIPMVHELDQKVMQSLLQRMRASEGSKVVPIGAGSSDDEH